MIVKEFDIKAYKVRNGLLWADIYLEDGGECGRLTIASYFVNGNIFFGGTGKPFTDFIAELSPANLAKYFKVAPSHGFDIHDFYFTIWIPFSKYLKRFSPHEIRN